jgi:hypothetical protein
MTVAEEDLWCKNTVSLFIKYFNDIETIQRIVINNFSNAPSLQFHFLKSFIVKQADVI